MVQKKVKKLLVITGPTAVGKSSYAVEVAQRTGGEVVSADSMQVYKYMDIGTGKITDAEKHNIPHHMIDVAMPNEDYSVGRYVVEARKAIDDIYARGKLPIVTGGTGLYLNSLLFDHTFGGVPKNEEIRQRLKDFAEKHGSVALYEKLKAADPQSASEINVNDTKRIIRALEIFETTGKPRGELKDNMTPAYDYKMIIITDDREALYARIDKRVDKMVADGLFDEVRSLYKYKNCNSMQAIGYKEVIAHFDGEISSTEAVELIKQNSRKYAKRQMTFFRGMKQEKTFVDLKDLDIRFAEKLLSGDNYGN